MFLHVCPPGPLALVPASCASPFAFALSLVLSASLCLTGDGCLTSCLLTPSLSGWVHYSRLQETGSQQLVQSALCLMYMTTAGWIRHVCLRGDQLQGYWTLHSLECGNSITGHSLQTFNLSLLLHSLESYTFISISSCDMFKCPVVCVQHREECDLICSVLLCEDCIDYWSPDPKALLYILYWLMLVGEVCSDSHRCLLGSHSKHTFVSLIGSFLSLLLSVLRQSHVFVFCLC